MSVYSLVTKAKYVVAWAWQHCIHLTLCKIEHRIEHRLTFEAAENRAGANPG